MPGSKLANFTDVPFAIFREIRAKFLNKYVYSSCPFSTVLLSTVSAVNHSPKLLKTNFQK